MSLAVSDVRGEDSSFKEKEITIPTPTADQTMLKLLVNGNSMPTIASQLGVSTALVESTLQPLAQTPAASPAISHHESAGTLSIIA